MSNVIFKNIKSKASEKKLSLSAIEKECGLGNGTIKGWESGNPTLRNIERVANVLDCSVAELLTESK